MSLPLLGAIIGDVMGSSYERSPVESSVELLRDGSRFTDDTVLTCAVAEALMEDKDFAWALRRWGLKYPDAGYGARFKRWLADPSSDSKSVGNGSAMRVSPVGWFFNTLEEVLHWAEVSARVSHDTPQAVRGAMAASSAVFLCRTGASREEVASFLKRRFGYRVLEVPGAAGFDATCDGSVPQAIGCALMASSFEDAMIRAIMLRGDADTQCAIAASVAQCLFTVPEWIIESVRAMLPHEILRVNDRFVGLVPLAYP